MTVDYGIDLSCVTDLDSTLRTVSGRMLLAEAIVRRITTPNGGLIDDPNYGIDVRDWLNDGLTFADLRRREMQVDSELVKDERILSSSTVASVVNGILSLEVAVVDGDGPFSLTLAVSDVTVRILNVG